MKLLSRKNIVGSRVKIYSSGYKIECRSSQGDQEFNEPPTETELRVSDLSPSTNYRFRIQATNDRGSSPFTGEHLTYRYDVIRFVIYCVFPHIFRFMMSYLIIFIDDVIKIYSIFMTSSSDVLVHYVIRNRI